MLLFLTSSPSGPLNVPNYGKVLDEKNGFVRNMKQYWKPEMRGLIICAAPDSFDGNDEMRDFFEQAFRNSGVPVTGFDLWDYRAEDMSAQTLAQYDVVMIGGGHVPTQNQFFQQIHLKEMMQGFDGIVIGVSAGTMNSASLVYAQPEMEGESVDPDYRRYLDGLGLTNLMILPHYQMVKDYLLDGRRLFEDITYGDSYGKWFLALEDGSYVLVKDGTSTLLGRAYRIADGEISQICEEGEMLPLGSVVAG